jgi:LemA protein
MSTLVSIVVLVGIVGYGFVLYNSLVKLRNRVDNGWAQIDVQLQRRSDLIPNLVATVKGYAAHERETLEAVIAARTVAVSASSPREAASGDSMLTAALGKLLALREAYPDLKADSNFRQLQEELTSTEDRVAYARQFYNDATTRYNTRIETIPASVVAKLTRFTTRELFEAPPEARDTPTVSF